MSMIALTTEILGRWLKADRSLLSSCDRRNIDGLGASSHEGVWTHSRCTGVDGGDG